MLSRIINALRRGSAAMSREYAQEIVGILFQHDLQADWQLRLVLRKILRRDVIQRLLTRVRVRVMHARLIVGGRRRQATFPARDSAGSIACHFAAQRC